MRLEVTYPGRPEPELDDLIRKAMEGIGAKWISMAYDHTTKTRDFHFDWQVDRK